MRFPIQQGCMWGVERQEECARANREGARPRWGAEKKLRDAGGGDFSVNGGDYRARESNQSLF